MEGRGEVAPGKHIGYKTDVYPIMHYKCCFDIVLLLRENVVLMSRGLHGIATGNRIDYNTDVYPITHAKYCFDVVQMLFYVVQMLWKDVILMSRGQNGGPPRKHMTCGWCLRRRNCFKTASKQHPDRILLQYPNDIS